MESMGFRTLDSVLNAVLVNPSQRASALPSVEIGDLGFPSSLSSIVKLSDEEYTALNKECSDKTWSWYGQEKDCHFDVYSDIEEDSDEDDDESDGDDTDRGDFDDDDLIAEDLSDGSDEFRDIIGNPDFYEAFEDEIEQESRSLPIELRNWFPPPEF